jgi:hypothetical protein
VVAHYGGHQQAQEVTAQSSFYSANDRRLPFGLGVETSADLTIRWTNGKTETISAHHGSRGRGDYPQTELPVTFVAHFDRSIF